MEIRLCLMYKKKKENFSISIDPIVGYTEDTNFTKSRVKSLNDGKFFLTQW